MGRVGLYFQRGFLLILWKWIIKEQLDLYYAQGFFPWYID